MLCRNSVVAKIWRKIRIYVAYQRSIRFMVEKKGDVYIDQKTQKA